MSLDNDAQIETIDRNHSLGRRVYVRSLSEDRSGAVAEKRELCLFLLARPAVLQRLLPRGRHGAARLYQSQWIVILSFHGLARHAGRQRDRKPALYPPRRRGVPAPGAHTELYGAEKGQRAVPDPHRSLGSFASRLLPRGEGEKRAADRVSRVRLGDR